MLQGGRRGQGVPCLRGDHRIPADQMGQAGRLLRGYHRYQRDQEDLVDPEPHTHTERERVIATVDRLCVWFDILLLRCFQRGRRSLGDRSNQQYQEVPSHPGHQ